MSRVHYSIVNFVVGIILCLSPQKFEAKDLEPFYELSVNIKPELGLAEVEINLLIPVHLIQNSSLSFLLSTKVNNVTLSGDHLNTYTTDEAGPGISLYTLEVENIPDTSIVINMVYSIVISGNHEVNRITEDWIELNVDSFWHPFLTSFTRFQYRMTIDLDKSYKILTGDNVRTISENSDLRVVESATPRVDIAFSASRHFLNKEGDYSLIFTKNLATNLDSLLFLSEQALTFLEHYIDRSDDFVKKRIVVESPREDVGYARENYVVLSKLDDLDAVYLSGFLAHEFSHFWFSTTNPQTQDYWLDESFAEFLSMICIREIYGYQAYSTNLENKLQRIKSDSKPLDTFQGRPSHIAMYYLGPVILHHYEEYLGSDQFQYLIQQMIEERISSTEDLLLLIRKLFGSKAEQKLIELRGKTF